MIRIGRLGKLGARSWGWARLGELSPRKHPMNAVASKEDRQNPQPV
jgi:hypothetical protein